MAEREIAKGDVRFRVDEGEDRRYAEFWDWFESPTWEPDTVRAYTACVGPGTSVLDVGGWIGPTTLLAAALGATVVAVEPDPVASRMLRHNLELNPDLRDRVTVLELAVGSRDGTVELTSDAAGGDSLSHLRFNSGPTGTEWVVEAVSMPTLLARPEVGSPQFVKFDAEGAEYAAIPAIAEHVRRTRPTVYLSTHPNLLYDRGSLPARLRSAWRTFRDNRRLLAALSTYRHHYVEREGRLEDIRRANRLRALLPLPARPLLLVGSCLFTDTRLDS